MAWKLLQWRRNSVQRELCVLYHHSDVILETGERNNSIISFARSPIKRSLDHSGWNFSIVRNLSTLTHVLSIQSIRIECPNDAIVFWVLSILNCKVNCDKNFK